LSTRIIFVEQIKLKYTLFKTDVYINIRAKQKDDVLVIVIRILYDFLKIYLH